MRPNVLLITCHDLGRHLGCYGAGSVPSPRLDALAAEGRRHTGMSCTAPQCSPARASLFTGRYPHSNGVMGLAHGAHGWDFNDGERHIAQIFGESGYQCAGMGVVHEAKSTHKLGFEQLTPGNFPAWELANHASDFLKKRDEERPFYLQVGFWEPHREGPAGFGNPVWRHGAEVPPFLVESDSARAEFAAYQGYIQRMDSGVGSILDRLDELGLRDNTVVLFTTDHGMPFPRAKCTCYEAGLEVAAIWRYPGRGWNDGRSVDGLSSHIDVLPTLCELCAVPMPESVQGTTLTPLIDNGRLVHEHVFGEMTYHNYCLPMRSVRDERYKLIVNFTTGEMMDSSQSWHPACQPVVPAGAAPAVELYDLVEDPHELDNLAGQPDHASTKQRLLDTMRTWLQETDDPILSGIPVPPRYHQVLDALGLTAS